MKTILNTLLFISVVLVLIFALTGCKSDEERFAAEAVRYEQTVGLSAEAVAEISIACAKAGAKIKAERKYFNYHPNKIVLAYCDHTSTGEGIEDGLTGAAGIGAATYIGGAVLKELMR